MRIEGTYFWILEHHIFLRGLWMTSPYADHGSKLSTIFQGHGCHGLGYDFMIYGGPAESPVENGGFFLSLSSIHPPNRLLEVSPFSQKRRDSAADLVMLDMMVQDIQDIQGQPFWICFWGNSQATGYSQLS